MLRKNVLLSGPNDVAADRLKAMIAFILRMNPLALPKRTEEQERLNGVTVVHVTEAIERRRQIERAEKDVRHR